MAATVTVTDLIQQSRMSNRVDGLHGTRRFLVTGAANVASYRLVDALLAAGAPQPGDPHPTASAILCSEITAEPASDASKDQMFLTATYDPPTYANRAASTSGICEFECGSTMGKKTYFTDRNGSLMSVTATVGGLTFTPQQVKAEIDFPLNYLKFKRLEPFGQDYSKVFLFPGRVNSANWAPGGITFQAAPRTVLCMPIRAKLQGSCMLFEYEFQYNYATYDIYEVYKDPVTKQLITTGLTGTPSSGTTIPSFRVYPEIDFTPLGLYTGQ